MTVQPEKLLRRYQYDPLDRVADCATLDSVGIQRFYQKKRLATEIQGQMRYSFFAHETQLLAQQQQQASQVGCALLATDLQSSVLSSVAAEQHQRPVYSPYGHRSPGNGLISLLGFNGERRDSVTGHYLLGNGHRAFNPVLMRFNSPDRLSPFGKGGVNAYAYCLGDPVNMVDPKGEFGFFVRGIEQLASGAVSIGQRIGKRFRGVNNSVSSKFEKPVSTQAMAGAELTEVYDAGAKYRLAKERAHQVLARIEKFERFAVANEFPDSIQYKLPKEQLPLIKAFDQADDHLTRVAERYVSKYPNEEPHITQLVQMVREQ
ncbi:RHS repeat-associated core domain-containing protein [Pseudomonas sp. LB3P31]